MSTQTPLTFIMARGACAAVRPFAALTTAAALAAMAVSASAAPFNPSRLPALQLGQIEQICHAVIGIPPGVRMTTDCVQNLSASAVALSRVRALDDARGACLGKGLASGDVPLCELSSARQHAAPASGPTDIRINTASLPPVATSYYSASARELRLREQTACARLGYDPADAGFAKCVASLDSSLFASEHVMQ